jgi:hypothetical protein
VKYIIDCETGKETIREMTKAEEAAETASAEAYADSIKQAEAELAERETKKQEILARLGITAEEATLLLG